MPNPLLGISGTISADSVTHPKTFAPEFVNAFELGTKNTLFDGALTLNGDVFYYDYKGYQISQIVDRSSINLNFDAKVRGAEIETTYEPLPGLRFNFAGGWEDTKLNNGSQAIDLMDRTAGHTDWQVVKPSVFSTSNCILPQYVVAELALETGLINTFGYGEFGEGGKFISSLGTGMACELAYNLHSDPVTYAQDHQIHTALIRSVRFLRRGSIPQQHPTMARVSTKISLAINCRTRHRLRFRSVRNTPCR